MEVGLSCIECCGSGGLYTALCLSPKYWRGAGHGFHPPFWNPDKTSRAPSMADRVGLGPAFSAK